MAGHSIRARSGQSTLAQNALAAKKKGKGGASAKAATQAFSGGDQQVIKTGQATKSTGQSIGEGAAAGAVAGSVVPGIGTLIGAGIGAAGAAVSANQADKAGGDEPNRPKRRRLAAALEGVQENRDKGQRALATLSQAVFDWAATIR